MDAFFKTEVMKKHRRGFLEKEILFTVIFVLFCVLGRNTFTGKTGLWMVAYFDVFAVVLLCEKYLSVPKLGNGERGLAALVRFHAFDEVGFFHMLTIRVLAVLGGMTVMISGAWIHEGTPEYIPWAFLIFAVSFLLFLAVRVCFHRRLTRESSLASKIYYNFLYGAIQFAGLLIQVVYGIILLMLLYAVVSDRLAFAKFEDSTVVFCMYNNYFISFVVILFCLYVVSFYSPQFFLSRYKIIFLGGTILCMLGGFVNENLYNTVITETAIVDTELGKKYIYSFEDVESFAVWDNKEVKMDLLMKDGRTVSVMGNEYTITEAWSEKYATVYNFLSDLTERLLSVGADGTIKDVEKLRENVKTLDPECIRGMEEVIALLEE